MTLRESKRVLRTVSLACWWDRKIMGRKVPDTTNILRDANEFLITNFRGLSEERRAEIEKAMNVLYVGAAR